jgi:tetratricopeptide (TPR) repeat protein
MNHSRTNGLMNEAGALLELGRPQEALQVAGMAALMQPADAAVYCVTATVHIATGDIADAFPEIRRALEIEPAWEWPHRLEAMALLRQAEDLTGRKARRLQRKAAEAARHAVLLGPLVPEAHYVQAFAELTLGRLRKARTAAAKAVELDPDDPPGWVVTALVELSQRQWAAAGYAAQRALALDPEDEAAMTVLATARRRLAA